MNFRSILHQLFMILNFVKIISGYGLNSNHQGPIFILEPRNEVNFLNTKGAVIDCLAHGYPDPTIRWITEDGVAVNSVPGLLEFPTNGSMVFKSFESDSYDQPIHARVYRCSVSNRYGRILSRKVKVRAVVMQPYEAQVYNEFVISGNVAVMKCHIPSFVRDHVVVTSWIREDEKAATISKTYDKNDMYIVSPTGSLYIRNANFDDRNVRYRCQTKHELTGEIKTSLTSGKIIISEPEGTVPPRITDRIAILEANSGESVQLYCAGQGHPPPNYRWYFKNDQEELTPLRKIAISDLRIDDERIIIEKASKDHVGTYVCIVSNIAGKQQTEITLIINSPLTVYISPQASLTDAGSTANFTCSVSGGPIKTISWMKNGYSIDSSSTDVALSEDKRFLSIFNVDKEKEGMYQCFIENSWVSGQGSSQLILGASKPTIINGFGEALLSKGSRLLLECKVDGKPSPDIKWFLDGRRISEEHGVSISVHQSPDYGLVGRLAVDRIRRRFSGDYSCIAINKAGNVSHTTRIDVRGAPSIKTFRNLTVISGSTVRIKCHVTGYPISKVIWLKDVDVPLLSTRYSVSNRLLTIKKVEKASDNGQYSCIASNNRSQSDTKHLWIKVIEKPFLDDMADKDVEPEISLKLMCSAIKGDPPINFQWSFDGHSLPDNLGLMITKHSDVSLMMIPSVQLVHGGNYTCTATNEAGSAEKTARVSVKSPPSWRRMPDKTVFISKNSLMLNCEASGNPEPNITWSLMSNDGIRKVLNNSSKNSIFTNGTLLLLDALQTNYSEEKFECSVNNALGKISHIFTLKKGEKVKIVIAKDEIIANIGDEVQIKCDISGSDPLSIKWMVNDRVIHTNSKLSISNIRSDKSTVSIVKLEDFQEKDSGDYKCLASNLLGSAYRIQTLTPLDVLVPNKIGQEHVTLKKDDNTIFDLMIPLIVICIVIVFVVIIIVMFVKYRNNRSSSEIPIYGNHASSTKPENLLNEFPMKKNVEVSPTNDYPLHVNHVGNKYSSPQDVPNYYCDISPYATFQLPQTPRPILTTFTSGKDNPHQSTFV